jgi:hypothetical protein
MIDLPVGGWFQVPSFMTGIKRKRGQDRYPAPFLKSNIL